MNTRNKKATDLKQAYAYCEEIIKKHSKSFYFAFSKLPKDKANAVYAIYAFCRLADDSIDEAETKKQQAAALKSLAEELGQFEQGNESDHFLWIALRDVFDRYDMSIQPFYDQLKGQTMDYRFKQPETMKTLVDYSYYVAGSVGLMLLPIIAVKNHSDLKKEAIALGVAMQLTNILRDVGEDFNKIDRIYLPKDLMNHYGYRKEDLFEQLIDEKFVQIWENIAHRAEQLYDDFFQSLNLFDEDSQFQVALSAKVYGGILDAVRENGYDCFTQKNKTSSAKKALFYTQVKNNLSGK
ncbi:phytoene/squalene synthase family protein [Alkalibacterium kapii]|uniref:Dehydrosqualene synthase n=1 Tax=Alkalibacterium kapii TaxID=426704 RepID=A0A511AW99_9LACT|nr:phytoene/squalene synthase family protein [Alkalibacterium kapii]GEK91391.1 dehydrosqualene synthase [Alkalibacterium kapii]